MCINRMKKVIHKQGVGVHRLRIRLGGLFLIRGAGVLTGVAAVRALIAVTIVGIAVTVPVAVVIAISVGAAVIPVGAVIASIAVLILRTGAVGQGGFLFRLYAQLADGVLQPAEVDNGVNLHLQVVAPIHLLLVLHGVIRLAQGLAHHILQLGQLVVAGA